MSILTAPYAASFLNAFRMEPALGQIFVPLLPSFADEKTFSVSSGPLSEVLASAAAGSERGIENLGRLEAALEEMKERKRVRIDEGTGRWSGTLLNAYRTANFYRTTDHREINLTANDEWRFRVDVGSQKMNWGRRAMSEGLPRSDASLNGVRYQLAFQGDGYDAFLKLAGASRDSGDFDAIVRSLLTFLDWEGAAVAPLTETPDVAVGPAYKVEGKDGHAEVFFVMGQGPFDSVAFYLHFNDRARALGDGAMVLWRLAMDEPSARVVSC